MADEKDKKNDKTLDDEKPKEDKEKEEVSKKDSALASVDKVLGDEVAKETAEEETPTEMDDSIQIKITLDIPKVFFELIKNKPKNNKQKK